ncbi:MAG: tRNA (N6-threonylcarbamoyladenosine(37)-N6)-methyltransferase TrmO [Chloroflexota bacterium]
MPINIEPIGYVENSIDAPIDSGWAKVESGLVFRKDLIPALSGLNQFSHVVIVFWMHQAKSPTVLARRPQNRNDMPEVGILSQRSKHRPNPIGITSVRLVKMDGCRLLVRGLDAINGTPVLDIKPYYPDYDSRPEARVPEWVNRLMRDYF